MSEFDGIKVKYNTSFEILDIILTDKENQAKRKILDLILLWK